MVFLIKASQLVLSLAILIVLHEFGHFIPARIFKTRVEKFFLFFDPWFALYKKKVGDTTWGIGWLPLGGYVKIAGMIDESMDKEQMAKEPEEWEFRAKPAWQRLIIMLGGVTVNLILGILIFIMVMFVWGSEYLPNENVKYGIALGDSTLYEAGLREGDKIITVGEKAPKDLGEAGTLILIDGERSIKVNRNEEEVTIDLPDDMSQKIMGSGKKVIFAPRFPVVIKDLPKKATNASKAGLQANDSIVRINNKSVPFFNAFSKELQAHADQEVKVVFYRDGTLDSLQVDVTSDGKLGFMPKPPGEFLDFKHVDYSFTESIPAGFSKAMETLTKYVKSLGLVFTKEGASQLGGFGAIGGMFSPTWDWHSFWLLTGFLSIILAFMNILPIPALDGGHVMFLLYEIISGRKPPEKFMEYAQIVGMVLLLALLLYANLNDVFKAFF